ncbi:HAD family hydrolase [Trueperella sp.]|uniref:HAD family hydrolase n=1 Tax=Trueperella sp. TaxID=2699835 RepID=UPI003736972E
MVNAVLFDLDGTLADSGPIITQTISQTMRELAGLDQPDDTYRRYVGPPLTSSFAHLGVAEPDIEAYIEYYRASYDKVHHQTPVFEGVVDLLDTVREKGFAVALATSKLQTVAEEVVRNLGLVGHIDILCGSQPDEVHLGKPAVVEEALNQLKAAGFLDEGAREEQGMDVPLRDDVVMVGDRIYDIEGARQHGVRTILVTWGDSWPEEEALAWKTADTPGELVEILTALQANGFDD